MEDSTLETGDRGEIIRENYGNTELVKDMNLKEKLLGTKNKKFRSD